MVEGADSLRVKVLAQLSDVRFGYAGQSIDKIAIAMHLSGRFVGYTVRQIEKELMEIAECLS